MLIDNSDNYNNNNNFQSKGAIIYYPRFEWTTNHLIDQIFIYLIKTREENDGITRRYEKRAKWYLRRVNLWNPPPEFIIYRKDFSKQIYQELVRLQKESPKTLNYVITTALEMLFESIEEIDEPVFNGEYYLLTTKIPRLFKWRFDRREDPETEQDSKYNINYDVFSND